MWKRGKKPLMNNYLFFLSYLFFLHFLADFVFQSDWMAKGKSKELYPLLCHVLIYTAVFLVGTICLNSRRNADFAILNGIIHFGVDFITSRINSKLYQSGNNHSFFIGVGFDQLIHAITIILTSQLL